MKKNIKLFKLLNDEIFWIKLCNVSLSKYRINRLREYRTKYVTPNKIMLTNFIEEDYRFITWDTRDTRDIILDLLSEVN